MDIVILKCNNPINGYCRKELRQEAFVTTCSHAFCRACVESHNFHDPAGGRRECLACGTILATEDDVRQANLRPNEQWKLTILAGLQPGLISEIAGKGATFWEYQMSSQLAWEQHLAAQWSKKYSALHKNAGRVIEEANTEIAELQDQVAALKQAQEETQRHMQDLVNTCNERKEENDKVNKLYRTLKAKVQRQEVQEAAKVSTEHAVQGMAPRTMQSTMPHRNDPKLNVPELPLLNKTPHKSRYAAAHGEVEQLHTHQRSGSARHTSSDLAAKAMPPPLSHATRGMHTPKTPVHRVSYPVTATNHTYPMTVHRPVGNNAHASHALIDGYRPSHHQSRQSCPTRTANHDPNIHARRSMHGGSR